MNNKYDNMVKIKTDFGYIEIATENYHEGDKMYFTFNEAIKLEFPDNWRLPTYKEIEAIKAALIFENGKMFIEDIKGREKVEIPLSGQETNNDGTYGYYWSSTIATIVLIVCACIRVIVVLTNLLILADCVFVVSEQLHCNYYPIHLP